MPASIFDDGFQPERPLAEREATYHGVRDWMRDVGWPPTLAEAALNAQVSPCEENRLMHRVMVLSLRRWRAEDMPHTSACSTTMVNLVTRLRNRRQALWNEPVIAKMKLWAESVPEAMMGYESSWRPRQNNAATNNAPPTRGGLAYLSRWGRGGDRLRPVYNDEDGGTRGATAVLPECCPGLVVSLAHEPVAGGFWNPGLGTTGVVTQSHRNVRDRRLLARAYHGSRFDQVVRVQWDCSNASYIDPLDGHFIPADALICN